MDKLRKKLGTDTPSMDIAPALTSACQRVITKPIAFIPEEAACALVASRALPVRHTHAHGGAGWTPAIARAVLTWPREAPAILAVETALADVAIFTSEAKLASTGPSQAA